MEARLPHSQVYRRIIIESLGSKCQNCGGLDGLEIDHKVPRKLGGSDSLDNLHLLCSKCHKGKHTNNRAHPKNPKLWLSAQATEAILLIAQKHSKRDWLIFQLCRHGLRIGEILGRGRLPGILVQDLRPTGFWLVGKGYSQDPPELYDLPEWLVKELIMFSAGKGPRQRLFQVGVRQTEKRIKLYSKEAGIQDWQFVRPHRLRAFFATDLKDRDIDSFTIRDMMRHKNIGTTNLYVGRGSPERRAKIMSQL